MFEEEGIGELVDGSSGRLIDQHKSVQHNPPINLTPDKPKKNKRTKKKLTNNPLRPPHPLTILTIPTPSRNLLMHTPHHPRLPPLNLPRTQHHNPLNTALPRQPHKRHNFLTRIIHAIDSNQIHRFHIPQPLLIILLLNERVMMLLLSLFCGASVPTERICKSLRKKIIQFDNWTMGLVGNGNFRMAGGEEEGFGGAVVGMRGEDGEELGRSFSAGAGDEDCHLFVFFVFSFLFLFFVLFFYFLYFLGEGEVGFWIEEGRFEFLCVGENGRKVSQRR